MITSTIANNRLIRKVIIGTMLLAVPMMCGCWGGGKAPRAFSTELSSSDSLTIQMGNYALLKYHSDRLGFDINYPDFLIRQDLPEDAGMQELFMMNDVSVSFMVDSLHTMYRTSGQTLMAMGADLVDVGDDYSIHEGQDDKWEYYSKVINSDSLRQVTIQQRQSAPGHHHPALLPRTRRSRRTTQRMGPRLQAKFLLKSHLPSLFPASQHREEV